MNELKYIDLFAGCGGISLGLYQAGLAGVFAIEKSPDAFHTLKHNLIDTKSHFDWPKWLELKNWNIDSLLETKSEALIGLRGKIDLVVGGTPCQGFSLVGERRPSDIRNELIHSYLSFVEIVQPRAIMFENVRGFTVKFSNGTNPDKTTYSEILIRKLHELGYKDAHGEMLNLVEYGVPQRRQRFVVIATREGSSKDIFSNLEAERENFLATKGILVRNSTEAALSDIECRHGTTECPDSKRFMSGISSPPQTSLQKYLRLSDKATYIPDSHRFVNHTPEIQEVFERLLETAPRNKRIYGDERNSYGIKKRNVTVLDPNEPSLTITTIPDDFIHYCEPRVMTVRECARLQSFPDWFEFKGRYTTGGERRVKQTPRYTQVGNAVPPLFAEQLGLAMKRVLANV